MERWELEYLHNKALRDTQCKVRGIEIPKDEAYGSLKSISGLFARWDGPRFHDALKGAGHDAVDINRCTCIKGRGERK